MPSYHFDAGILVITSGARFTTAELEATLRAALEDPRFEPGMHALFDNRGSQERASAKQISDRIRTMQHLGGQLSRRRAIVVSDLLHLGLGRVTESLARLLGWEVRTFAHDIDEAKAWLTEASRSAQPAKGLRSPSGVVAARSA